MKPRASQSADSEHLAKIILHHCTGASPSIVIDAAYSVIEHLILEHENCDEAIAMCDKVRDSIYATIHDLIGKFKKI